VCVRSYLLHFYQSPLDVLIRPQTEENLNDLWYILLIIKQMFPAKSWEQEGQSSEKTSILFPSSSHG
jgi:hypothetical protein